MFEVVRPLLDRPHVLQDMVLRPYVEVLKIQEEIDSINAEIAALTIFEMEEDDTPTAIGFANPGKVEELSDMRRALSEQKEYFLDIVDKIEKVFKDFGETPRSEEAIGIEIKNLGNLVFDISVRINRQVRRLIENDEGIALGEIWSNPEIQVLEHEKAEAARTKDAKIKRLVELLDAIRPIASPAYRLAEEQSRPGRRLQEGFERLPPVEITEEVEIYG